MLILTELTTEESRRQRRLLFMTRENAPRRTALHRYATRIMDLTFGTWGHVLSSLVEGKNVTLRQGRYRVPGDAERVVLSGDEGVSSPKTSPRMVEPPPPETSRREATALGGEGGDI